MNFESLFFFSFQVFGFFFTFRFWCHGGSIYHSDQNHGHFEHKCACDLILLHLVTLSSLCFYILDMDSFCMSITMWSSLPLKITMVMSQTATVCSLVFHLYIVFSLWDGDYTDCFLYALLFFILFYACIMYPIRCFLPLIKIVNCLSLFYKHYYKLHVHVWYHSSVSFMVKLKYSLQFKNSIYF